MIWNNHETELRGELNIQIQSVMIWWGTSFSVNSNRQQVIFPSESATYGHGVECAVRTHSLEDFLDYLTLYNNINDLQVKLTHQSRHNGTWRRENRLPDRCHHKWQRGLDCDPWGVRTLFGRSDDPPRWVHRQLGLETCDHLGCSRKWWLRLPFANFEDYLN